MASGNSPTSEAALSTATNDASTRPYRTVTVTLKEGDVLNLGPHDQAFYKGTEHRNQYGIWHQFVLLVLDENDQQGQVQP